MCFYFRDLALGQVFATSRICCLMTVSIVGLSIMTQPTASSGASRLEEWQPSVVDLCLCYVYRYIDTRTTKHRTLRHKVLARRYCCTHARKIQVCTEQCHTPVNSVS